MQAMVAHFLHPYGLFVECILFKCYKHIINHQFDKNIYGLRLPTWIRIWIEGWNSINIHQSCSNELLKWIYMDYNMGIALTFKYIFYYDFISIFFIGTQYMIHDGKKNMDWKKLQ
jgi:hypothetical protein